MAPLRILAALALLIVSAPAGAAADGTARWSELVEQSAQRVGLPPEWIARVMHIESKGQTSLAGRPIVSRAGAMGLMQLMPETWREMRALLGLGADPHDPGDNILAGAFYLRTMYDRFGYPGLFAAYNAGPRRYAEHLASGRALPAETRHYVAAAVQPSAGGMLRVARWSPPPLNIPARPMNGSAAELTLRPNAGTLFVPLGSAPGR